MLVTTHRTENVDNLNSLSNIIKSINDISTKYKVVLSLHPRTKDKLDKFDISLGDNVLVLKPFGFFDFVKLEKNAICVISDSGTVQEETCILGVPSITIRKSTERRETIECGSNILCGTDYNDIMSSFNNTICRNTQWTIPQDYQVKNVSDIVINILLGKK